MEVNHESVESISSLSISTCPLLVDLMGDDHQSLICMTLSNVYFSLDLRTDTSLFSVLGLFNCFCLKC